MGASGDELMICAGIDAGSRAVKVVVLDRDSPEVLASGAADQGVSQDRIGSELLDTVLSSAGLARRDVSRVVATGYGRVSLDFADSTITEITCHARGVHRHTPEARTVIDIGGQDSKLLRLEPDGRVRDFVVNDRCAAGTGRFLEVMAGVLDVPIEEFGEASARSGSSAAINSTCTVFAETEVISLIAGGARKEDIIAGLHAAIASRIAQMAGPMGEHEVFFNGGGALNGGVCRALERSLHRRVHVPPMPQFVVAVGAAWTGAAA